MAKVISEINGSGLFAQSANSASTAIFDKNGKDIAETYLTAHQSLDGLMSANSLEYNTEGQISGYNGSAFAAGGSEGKTYEGIAPIVVDNDNNTISADSIDVTEIDIGDGLKLENNTLSLTATIPSTAGLMETSKLEKNSDNLITAYDGTKFAAGGTGDGDMKTSLLEYNAANQISAYNGSAFAGGQDLSDNFDLSAGAGIELTVDESNKKVKVAVTGKEDTITYGYNDNKIISINGSALSAGAVYTGETPVIVDSTTNEISLDTVTASELEIGEGLKVEDGVISVTGGGGGTEYTAGANIDITNNVISGKDWSSDLNKKIDSSALEYGQIYSENDSITGLSGKWIQAYRADQASTAFYIENLNESSDPIDYSYITAGIEKVENKLDSSAINIKDQVVTSISGKYIKASYSNNAYMADYIQDDAGYEAGWNDLVHFYELEYNSDGQISGYAGSAMSDESKMFTSAIQFIADASEAEGKTDNVLYIVTGTN